VSEKRALVLGCGYVGLALTRSLVDAGVAVLGTTRGAGGEPAVRAAGAEWAQAEVMEPSTLRSLPDWGPGVVFDLVRPQLLGPDRYTARGTSNVAAAFEDTGLEALVYLSSTSVYGRRGGEWTDERTRPAPTSPLGRARLEAEEIYLSLARERRLPPRVCRAPGIYGPGRTLRQRLESGAYRRLDEEIWVSRVHVDDLCAGLVAAWRAGSPGGVYLVADDEPVTAREYVELTASLLSLPLPPTVQRSDIRGELSGSAFERMVGARRCSNRRMREELGVIPRYPSVREGVPAALRAEGAI
jgi:nucleoside-diphosphate-sugar epimerase